MEFGLIELWYSFAFIAGFICSLYIFTQKNCTSDIVTDDEVEFDLDEYVCPDCRARRNNPFYGFDDMPEGRENLDTTLQNIQEEVESDATIENEDL